MVEREIFTAVLNKKDPGERAALLDQVCAGDAPLRGRVESLLAEHAKLGSFMDVVSAAATLGRPVQEDPGVPIIWAKPVNSVFSVSSCPSALATPKSITFTTGVES